MMDDKPKKPSFIVPGFYCLIMDGEEEINLAKFAKYLNAEGKLDLPKGQQDTIGPIQIIGQKEDKGPSPPTPQDG